MKNSILKIGILCLLCLMLRSERIWGEKHATDSSVTNLDDFHAMLNNNTCFDPIRNRDEFKALYE